MIKKLPPDYGRSAVKGRIFNPNAEFFSTYSIYGFS